MSKQEQLQKLPGVDKLLLDENLKQLLMATSPETTTRIIRQTLEKYRMQALAGNPIPDQDEITGNISTQLRLLTTKSLKPVINATGIIVHTNLGRAPFGKKLLEEANEILTGYSNLEYDLETASRGSRYVHITRLLSHLTGAENVLVVNNNAAAIMLVLRAFAENKEVIISRGELIEIGGSFRMPDIMSASGCKMIEVGTTNKTKISDYRNAIRQETAMLLKVHRSNYIIQGFTTSPTLPELVSLGKKNSVPVVYDMGSGLLNKAGIEFLNDEPDVKTTLESGVDLVTFSGDKLLGGPQAGIIAGNKEMIALLKKNPLTRAMRVGKETLALLEIIALAYLDQQKLIDLSPIFQMMTATEKSLQKKAEDLAGILNAANIKTSVVESRGQAGGGSLPGKYIPSFAIKIEFENASRKNLTEMAGKMFNLLISLEKPILGILRQGSLLFDVLTILDHQREAAAEKIILAYKEILSNE
jgi:L-seryl-tRNA(Ser) seleniumtransferase